MKQDRRKFIERVALLAGGAGMVAAPTGVAVAAQNISPNHITVGEGGDVASISDALILVTNVSAVNQYVIELLPGVYPITGANIIPAYVSLTGAGRDVSSIDCTNQWSYLGFSGNQVMSDFSIRGIRTSSASAKGIMQDVGQVRDVHVENVTIYLKGGYGAAVYCNGFSTLRFRSLDIWTTSVGIQATGYIYLTDCHVRLTGNATATPYYGLTCFSGTGMSVRYYVFGGFYGTGYGTTNEPGFGGSGSSIVNDGLQPAIAFYIPPEHQKNTLTGTRFQLTGVECFVRNEEVVDATPSHCVRVDGAGIVRLFGGIYQAETPNYASRAWAVVNNNFGTHTTYGNVEMYSPRVSSVRGSTTSFAQEAVGKLSASDDGIQLNKYTCSSYFCDASLGGFTVRLPAVWRSGGPPQGSKLRFIKTDTTSNPVIVMVADGIATIEGVSSITLSVQYEKVQLLYGADGDEAWYLI